MSNTGQGVLHLSAGKKGVWNCNVIPKADTILHLLLGRKKKVGGRKVGIKEGGRERTKEGRLK